MRLEEKVAIVTGGGSGIGRAAAIALAREGAAVVVANRNQENGQDTIRRVTAAGGTGTFIETDVTDPEQCRRLVSSTVARYGALHILFNNAGIAVPFEDGFTPNIEPAAWDRIIRTNLSSVFYCSKYAISEMADAGGGSIINNASSQALLPLGLVDAYTASKGAVMTLTKSSSVGAALLGIRINAICPGYVDTPMNAPIWGSDELRASFERHHARGLQSTEEIADVVVFLASDASRSLTGAVLTCDAGWTAFKQPDVLRAY